MKQVSKRKKNAMLYHLYMEYKIWHVLPVAGHRRRGRQVELAVGSQNGERDPLVGTDLGALAVTVTAQPLAELARHVDHGARDGALRPFGVLHPRHPLGGARGRGGQTQPGGDGGGGKQTTDHMNPPVASRGDE